MSHSTVMFFLIGSIVWAAAHLYVGQRLVGPLRTSGRRRRLVIAGLVALWAFATASIVLGRVLADSAGVRALMWAAYLYMGLFVVVLPLLVTRDLVAVAALIVRKVRRRAANDHVPADPGRRRFLMSATNAGMLVASGAASGVGLVQALRLPEVVRVRVPVPGLPPELSGYRIAQISDLHAGPTIRGDYVRAVVERTNALSPDLVALTGDFVDGLVPELGPEVAPLASLRAPDGVFFVTGNHEYYWDAEAWCAELERLGFAVLNNAHRVVSRAGRTLLIAGATDYRTGSTIPGHASDPAGARRGAPACDLSVLLAHQPRSIDAAMRAGYDLVLSGHTHGGQFYPWALFVGLAHPFVAGLGRFGSTWLYVSRGTGYWGPPMRTGVPSEITLLELEAA